MDTLSQILTAFRFTSAIYCRLRGGTSWGVGLPEVSGASFHVVRSGACILHREREDIELRPGDIALCPRGPRHALLHHREASPVPLEDLLALLDGDQAPDITMGAEPMCGEVICGVFYFDRRLWDPMLKFLPEVLVLHQGDYSGFLLTSLLDCASTELQHPQSASDLVLSRIGDLLFVELMRAAARRDTLAGAHRGWMLAMRDPAMGRVLAAIHHGPGKPWSIDELAELACLSRSTFTARFRDEVGMSALQYLTRWRMIVAASYLEDTEWILAKVADAVGYASEVSFTRAFKQVVGVPPGRYRNEAPAHRAPRL